MSWRATGDQTDIAPAPGDSNGTDARATGDQSVDPAELIGARDVLTICGWKTRKTIGDAARTRAFPEPVACPSGFRLWIRTDVLAWKARQG